MQVLRITKRSGHVTSSHNATMLQKTIKLGSLMKIVSDGVNCITKQITIADS